MFWSRLTNPKAVRSPASWYAWRAGSQPKAARLGYPAFATLYSFASMLGIASHAPGGLGVFEATILQGVGGSEDAVLASLLLFRGIYYAVPFVTAMALLGGVEAVRRWRSLREAMSAPSED